MPVTPAGLLQAASVGVMCTGTTPAAPSVTAAARPPTRARPRRDDLALTALRFPPLARGAVSPPRAPGPDGGSSGASAGPRRTYRVEAWGEIERKQKMPDGSPVFPAIRSTITGVWDTKVVPQNVRKPPVPKGAWVFLRED